VPAAFVGTTLIGPVGGYCVTYLMRLETLYLMGDSGRRLKGRDSRLHTTSMQQL
jgi:hypothetical protein